MSLRDRITSTPDVYEGRACIRGTRIPVSVVLDELAGGRTQEQVLANHPSLDREDVLAALAHGADLVKAADERRPR